MRRRPYPRDPHFITARYAGTCGSTSCGGRISKGDQVFHYPNTSTTPCTGCSDGAARRFAAEMANEGSCAW